MNPHTAQDWVEEGPRGLPREILAVEGCLGRGVVFFSVATEKLPVLREIVSHPHPDKKFSLNFVVGHPQKGVIKIRRVTYEKEEQAAKITEIYYVM